MDTHTHSHILMWMTPTTLIAMCMSVEYLCTYKAKKKVFFPSLSLGMHWSNIMTWWMRNLQRKLKNHSHGWMYLCCTLTRYEYTLFTLEFDTSCFHYVFLSFYAVFLFVFGIIFVFCGAFELLMKMSVSIVKKICNNHTFSLLHNWRKKARARARTEREMLIFRFIAIYLNSCMPFFMRFKCFFFDFSLFLVSQFHTESFWWVRDICFGERIMMSLHCCPHRSSSS